MDEVISIEILITSINKNISLFIDYKNLTVNNRKKIDKEIIDELFNIICLWKNDYGRSNVIDAEEFIVKVNTVNGTDIFKGKGIFPSNYEVFLRIVGELND